jgi:hypothetical protein
MVMNQDPKKDFELLVGLLQNQTPFTFIRFSDGEMEIIRNERLYIGDNKVIWSQGEVDFSYPAFDYKDFRPERDTLLRSDLIESAKYQGENYFKGIPTKHNSAIKDRQLMISLNSATHLNLTFADLLLNENFRRFRKQIVPMFQNFKDVYFFANYRTQPKLMNSRWGLVPLEDNCFPNYEQIHLENFEKLINLPKGSLIISSASSLTNIVGFKLHAIRRDLTFIDVGTSMHDLVGLESGIREYHLLLEKNTPKNLVKKFKLKQRKNYRLEW